MDEKHGWGKPTATARKYHYFGDDFRSLCGNYGWLGSRDELEDEYDDHSENCASCKRKRLAQKAKEEQSAC